MKKNVIMVSAIVLAAVTGIVIWQNYTNSLSYQLRNCTEISDNSGYIGFTCPNRNPNYPATKHYVPVQERDQIKDLLSPVDNKNGSI